MDDVISRPFAQLSEQVFLLLLSDLLLLFNRHYLEAILFGFHVIKVEINSEKPDGLDTPLDSDCINFPAKLLDLLSQNVMKSSRYKQRHSILLGGCLQSGSHVDIRRKI